MLHAALLFSALVKNAMTHGIPIDGLEGAGAVPRRLDGKGGLQTQQRMSTPRGVDYKGGIPVSRNYAITGPFTGPRGSFRDKAAGAFTGLAVVCGLRRRGGSIAACRRLRCRRAGLCWGPCSSDIQVARGSLPRETWHSGASLAGFEQKSSGTPSVHPAKLASEDCLRPYQLYLILRRLLYRDEFSLDFTRLM